MGDVRTVAAVTRALRHVLVRALGPHGADVTIGSPGGNQESDVARKRSVNLFLYHVEPNPSLRNRDLPIWESGRMVNTPTIGLDLYYLLSFYGRRPNDLSAEILLGIAVTTLTAQPLLSQEDFESSRDLSDPWGTDSNQYRDTVALTPLSLSIEQMQRLWMKFPNTPYALSMSYRASAALLVGDQIAAPQLPVAPEQPAVKTSAAAPPVITTVETEDQAPATVGSQVKIEGSSLSGPRVAVELGGYRISIPAEDQSPQELTFTIPSRGVLAGTQTIRVLVLADGGSLADAQVLAASPSLPFSIAPKIHGKPKVNWSVGPGGDASGEVALQLKPAPGVGQNIGVLLNATSSDGSAYALPASVGSISGHNVDFPLLDTVDGDYLLRVEVDGATSQLEMGKNKYRSPRIRVTRPTKGESS